MEQAITHFEPWREIGHLDALAGRIKQAGAHDGGAGVVVLLAANHAFQLNAHRPVVADAIARIEQRGEHRIAVEARHAAPDDVGHFVNQRTDCRALQAERLTLLNDFEALALSLPWLNPSADLQFFGGGLSAPESPKAVLGPGTGLGLAGCVPQGARWVALATEGGHVTMCAADEFEEALLRALRPQHHHLSAERLLSGTGLPTLHRGVCLVNGWNDGPLTPEQITSRGMADDAP